MGAVLAVTVAAQSANAGNGCVRPIGGVHVPAFAGAVSEIEQQRECLVLEGGADPKAELLPPSGPRRAPRAVPLVVPGEGLRNRNMTFEEIFSPGSFHLGDPKLILAPR